jgi:sporulation protein YlmC with PRC-barrel domain
MPDPVSWFLIEPGWHVVDSAGVDVGKVSEVRGDEDKDIFDGLVVDGKYVPSEVVGPIVEGRIEVTVAADQLSELG